MINFSNNLYARMTTGLQRIAIQAENPLQRAEQSCREIEAVLVELKLFTRGYTFPDAEAEIAFFRDIKPRFLREFMYFTELFYLEAFHPVVGKDRQRSYLVQALDRVGAYFERNQWFYAYYRMNLHCLDPIFFQREGEQAPYWPIVPPNWMPAFPRFTATGFPSCRHTSCSGTTCRACWPRSITGSRLLGQRTKGRA